ncbi:MAG: DUF5320 domain-containing protein [Pseudomonadota bacterium]
MPRGDGTGPMGMGAMSGRAAGFCSGSGTPGYSNPVPGSRLGLGLRRGWGQSGGGRGGCRWNYAPRIQSRGPYGFYGPPVQGQTPDMEKQILKNQAEVLKSELNLIMKRLEDIEAGTNRE